MKRREALRAMSAVMLAPIAAGGMAAEGNPGNTGRKPVALKRRNSSTDKIVLGDSHFLSKTNPIATVDQRDLEALALKVLQMPIIRNAKTQATQRYKLLASHNITPEALLDFDDKMEEWTYHYVLLALNSDPNYPKVLNNNYGPAHEWFGMKVPGNRGPGTGENVDNNYAIVPIDGNARFELHGQRFSPAVGDTPLHLTTNLSMAMNAASIDSRDIQYNPDGSFIITIDREPAESANGRRPNHLQTTIDTRYLFIRDGRVDWRQVPNAYLIRRLDPPTAPPPTIEQSAAIAARFIVDDTSASFFFSEMVKTLEVNTAASPAISNLFGGQASQKLGRGHLKLTDDEAFVLTVDPGGSKHHTLALYNFWLMSGDYWNKTSSLNNTQSVANTDGTYTYVFSIQDPGVHNWIDTLGLHESLFLIRFQLLPRNSDGSYGGTASTRGQLVKLKDLESVLPAETKRVTPEERRQQLAERLAAFKLRFVV